ncbi:hypothetical protein [Paenibacillus harenae]|uniref:hypothetical protein n=1 Tax=Paenibacillus harenae TaxID=306543 RepID=UPI00278FF1A3|nr:hypothetical protein [Paenibacillus harenae]MDQ0061562.1 hypothetical protein [Paenibacillus harenae]
MMKKIGWLGKLVAAGLILSFLSIWTTGYIVTSYVDTLLKQYNLPLEVPPMAMSGVWGKLWGSDPPIATDAAEGGSGQDKPDTLPDTTASSGNGEQDEPPASEDAFGEIENPPLTDIGIGGGTEAGGTPSQPDTESGEIDGTETAVTTDDLTEVKEQMTDADKDTLFGLLMSKVPQESMQLISGYVEDGLTEQELTSVQQIMAQHLDKAEYEQMMNILKKY